MRNNPSGSMGRPTLGKGQPVGLARPTSKAGNRDSSAGVKSSGPSAVTRPGGRTQGGRSGGAPAKATRPGKHGG